MRKDRGGKFVGVGERRGLVGEDCLEMQLGREKGQCQDSLYSDASSKSLMYSSRTI